MEYNIDLFDGHLIITDSGKTLLIDTGSPVTLTDLDSFELMGQKYVGQSDIGGVGIKEVSRQLGRDIDILVGLDILRNLILVVDYRNRILEICDENPDPQIGCTVNIQKNGMGAITIPLTVSGRSYNFVLDTGAKISYVTGNETAADTPIEERQDFNPILGFFTTPIFRKKVEVGDLEFDCNFGNLPQTAEMMLAMIGIDGVIGFDLFNSFKVVIDLKQDRITIIPGR